MVEQKKVTIASYEATANFLTLAFPFEMTNEKFNSDDIRVQSGQRISFVKIHRQNPFPTSVALTPQDLQRGFDLLYEIETEKYLFSTSSKQKMMISVFADLDFYDFLDLWPDFFPLGVMFKNAIAFDNVVTDAWHFRDHDGSHSRNFVEQYLKLSPQERAALDRSIQFVREYRTRLSSQDQIIIGTVFGHLLHEVDRFPNQQQPSSLQNSPLDGFYIALNRSKDPKGWASEAYQSHLRADGPIQINGVRYPDLDSENFFVTRFLQLVDEMNHQKP